MSNFPLLLAQEAAQSVPENFFFGLDNEQRFVVLLTAIGCATMILIAIISTVYYLVNLSQRRNAEYNLKRDMLDRGMTADEITQVIEAVAPPEDATERWIASWGKRKK